MGLILTLGLGLFMLGGAALARFAHHSHLFEQMAIAVALGSMTALVLLDLLPEAMEGLGTDHWLVAVLCVLLGVGLLKLLDLFVPEHDHEHGFSHHCSEENVAHIGIVSSFAVILHNVIEGMAVYGICAESPTTGALMALGVGLHNIPMGMVIFSTLEHESAKKRTVLLASTTLSTFVGGLLMALSWGRISEFVVGMLICLTLGMLVYIVAFELLPHLLHTERKGLSLLGVLAGIGIILLSSLLG